MSLIEIQTCPQFNSLKTENKGYYLYVTEACNLRCSYCFVSDKQNHRHLTPEMTEKIKRFVTEDTEGRKSKYIHFFGGEPLIQARTVDSLATHFRVWAAANKCTLKLGITTNGTLLSVENCEMLKKHDIGVQLSLDGSPQGNDVHRQLMGGDQVSGGRKSGAFHLVKIENYIKYFGGKSPNCRMTVTPENMDYLLQSLDELVSIYGFKSFSVIGAADSKWPRDAIRRYREVMEDVFQWWVVDSRHKGVIVNTIKSYLDRLTRRKLAEHLCQAGKTVIGITVDGEIYPCHDFSGRFSKDPSQRSSLLLGTIDGGYTSNLSRYSDHRVIVEGEDRIHSGAGHDCQLCHARFTCEKGCPYVNRASTGDDWTVSPNYCEFNRIHHDLASRLITQLDGAFTLYSREQVHQLNTRINNLARRVMPRSAGPVNGKQLVPVEEVVAGVTGQVASGLMEPTHA